MKMMIEKKEREQIRGSKGVVQVRIWSLKKGGNPDKNNWMQEEVNSSLDAQKGARSF